MKNTCRMSCYCLGYSVGHTFKVARVTMNCVAGQEDISIFVLQGLKRGPSNEGTRCWMQEKDFILAAEVDLIIEANSLLGVRLPPSFEGKLFILSSLYWCVESLFHKLFLYFFPFFLTSLFCFNLLLISEKFPLSFSVLPSKCVKERVFPPRCLKLATSVISVLNYFRENWVIPAESESKGRGLLLSQYLPILSCFSCVQSPYVAVASWWSCLSEYT